MKMTMMMKTMMILMMVMMMVMVVMVSQLHLAKPSAKISFPPSTAVKTASVVYAHNHKTLQIFHYYDVFAEKNISLLVTLVDGSAAL